MTMFYEPKASMQSAFRRLFLTASLLASFNAWQSLDAGILVSYSGNSTNETLSGATATALFEFDFSYPLDDARRSVSVTITNTTGASLTQANLTGLAFDAPSDFGNIVFDSNTFTTTSELGTLLTGEVNFAPFTAGVNPSFDIAFSDDGDLEGGNPNSNSLAIGDTVTLSVEFTFDPEFDPVSATPTPSEIEARFLSGLSDDTLRTAVRFMAIEGGDGTSDKILGSIPTPDVLS